MRLLVSIFIYVTKKKLSLNELKVFRKFCFKQQSYVLTCFCLIKTRKLILLSRSKLEIHDSKAILFKEFVIKKIELRRWEGWRLDQLR